jgi:hypothetical protein
MEQNQTNILTYVAFGIGLMTSLVGAINHKRIRSTCCKKEISASFDVESTTPEIQRQMTIRPVSDPDKV